MKSLPKGSSIPQNGCYPTRKEEPMTRASIRWWKAGDQGISRPAVGRRPGSSTSSSPSRATAASPPPHPEEGLQTPVPGPAPGYTPDVKAVLLYVGGGLRICSFLPELVAALKREGRSRSGQKRRSSFCRSARPGFCAPTGGKNRGQQAAQEAIDRIRKRLPFTLLGIDCDNDSLT